MEIFYEVWCFVICLKTFKFTNTFKKSMPKFITITTLSCKFSIYQSITLAITPVAVCSAWKIKMSKLRTTEFPISDCQTKTEKVKNVLKLKFDQA